MFSPSGRAGVFGFDNPADEQYRHEYQSKMNVIQRTVQKQINDQTPFELFGLHYCDESQENQNKRIIIDMNNTETGARANILNQNVRVIEKPNRENAPQTFPLESNTIKK